MAGDRKLTVRFLGQDAGLTKGVKQLVSEMDAAESAGKRAALAIDFMTDKAVQGSREASAATEALSTALGQETVAAIERAGGSVDKWVGELKKAGLTYREVADDADALAASIRRAEDANGTFRPLSTGADEAATSVRRLGSEADQSRSVMANLVGNSAQDIAQLGGFAGTAGVAIGQLGEYAADGNIKLANLAKVAGPMAALGVATYAVTGYMAAQKREAEELARITEFLGDVQTKVAQNDFKGAASALSEEYSDSLTVLERYGLGIEDLINGIDGAAYVTRQLNSDIRDLKDSKQAMLDDPENFTPDEIQGIENEIAALEDLIETINEDAAANAAAARQREENNRRTSEAAGYYERMSGALRDTGADLADQDKAATSAANRIRTLRDEVEAYIASTEGIPDEAVTEIRAALDSGNVALVERLLANLARTRDAVVKVSLAFGAPTKQVGKGAAVGSGAKGSGAPGYDPQSVLAGIFSDAKATGGGGGGGGGGAGSATPEDDPMAEFDQAIGNLFDTGQTSLTNYRQYLQSRLGAYETFSNEYKTIWSKLRELDRIEADAAKEAAEAEKRKQEEAKKAAEEQTKLQEKQLAALRELLDLLTGFASADAGNLAGPSGNIIGSGASGSLNAGQLGGLIADLLRFYQEGVS